MGDYEYELLSRRVIYTTAIVTWVIGVAVILYKSYIMF